MKKLLLTLLLLAPQANAEDVTTQEVCRSTFELAEQVAIKRDEGLPLLTTLSYVRTQWNKNMIIDIYTRANLTPEQLAVYWFGHCIADFS